MRLRIRLRDNAPRRVYALPADGAAETLARLGLKLAAALGDAEEEPYGLRRRRSR